MSARERQLESVVREGIEAVRLTREYVGEQTLPAMPGWSWYDWTEKANLVLAEPEPESYDDEGTSPWVWAAGLAALAMLAVVGFLILQLLTSAT